MRARRRGRGLTPTPARHRVGLNSSIGVNGNPFPPFLGIGREGVDGARNPSVRVRHRQWRRWARKSNDRCSNAFTRKVEKRASIEQGD